MGSYVAALVLSAIALILAGLPVEAAAHTETASQESLGWTMTLGLLLGASALLYTLGVRRLWRRAGRWRGVRAAHVLRFVLGWSALACALLSPIDALADRSFALHMLQHELLMLVAAPLLVLARPLEAWTWALAPRARRGVVALAHARPLGRAWCAITGQPGAWCLHAAAVWIWHVPALFLAALADASLHVLQHTCFLTTALLFWWSIFRTRAGSHTAGAMASVFTTMLHTSALGALLTLAAHPSYVATVQPMMFGLTPLEDQQLGGLIMWVPGSLAYLVAGLILVAGWLSPARERHEIA